VPIAFPEAGWVGGVWQASWMNGARYLRAVSPAAVGRGQWTRTSPRCTPASHSRRTKGTSWVQAAVGEEFEAVLRERSKPRLAVVGATAQGG